MLVSKSFIAVMVVTYAAVRLAEVSLRAGRVSGGEVQVERREGYYGDKEKSSHTIFIIYKMSQQSIFFKTYQDITAPDCFLE